MGIKDMLKREDFYIILRDTILEYAQIVLGKEVCCEYTPFDGGEPWVVNRILGFVSRVPSPRGVRVYMKSEYNVRGNLVKNFILLVALKILSASSFVYTYIFVAIR